MMCITSLTFASGYAKTKPVHQSLVTTTNTNNIGTCLSETIAMRDVDELKQRLIETSSIIQTASLPAGPAGIAYNQ